MPCTGTILYQQTFETGGNLFTALGWWALVFAQEGTAVADTIGVGNYSGAGLLGSTYGMRPSQAVERDATGTTPEAGVYLSPARWKTTTDDYTIPATTGARPFGSGVGCVSWVMDWSEQDRDDAAYHMYGMGIGRKGKPAPYEDGAIYATYWVGDDVWYVGTNPGLSPPNGTGGQEWEVAATLPPTPATVVAYRLEWVASTGIDWDAFNDGDDSLNNWATLVPANGTIRFYIDDVLVLERTDARVNLDPMAWETDRWQPTGETGRAGSVRFRPSGRLDFVEIRGEADVLYDCPGASAGSSLCGSDNVLTWIEQTQTTPGSPASLARVVSDIALNDLSTYYGGKKEPRVLGFGPITRRLSDVQGQWQGATMTWREAEIDRVLRGRLADGATRALTQTAVVCRMIREPEWVEKLPARTMFIGQVQRVQPGEDLSIDLEAGDTLARDVETEETQCPRRLISSQYLPGTPTAAIGLGEPILYGRLSGALSAVTPPVLDGDPARGAYVDGGVQNFGYGDLPDPPSAPSGVTLTEVGGGGIATDEGPSGSSTYYAFVTSVDADGNESDPDTFTQRDAGAVASVTIAGATAGITVAWTSPGSPEPVAYRVYLCWNYYGLRVVQRLQVAAGGALEATFTNCPTFTEWTLNDWTQLGVGAVRSPYSFYAYWAVTAVVAGDETALSAIGTALADGYRRPIRVEWEAVPNATEYRVYRRAYAGAPWDRRWTVDATGSPETLYLDDDLLDTGAAYISEGPVDKGIVPVTYVGQETLTATGETWYRFLVAGHAITAIDEWYLDGVLEDVGTAGVDYLIPGYAGWAERFGTPTYRDSLGRRYTLIYARGPKGDALAGVATGSPATATTSVLLLNVRGIEDQADGTGALITDAFEQFLHWFINWGPLGDYQTGAWLPAPTWTPLAEHCQIDTDSFRAASAAAALDVPGGYVGAGVLSEPASLRDWIARWCLSTDTRIGLNASGQWAVWRQSSDEEATIARTYTELRHIQAGSFTLTPLREEHWNRLLFVYRRNPATGDWDSGEQAITDAESIATYSDTRTRQTIELWFVASAAVATDILTRTLARHADPPLAVTFETIDLCGTLSELGDVIGVTHIAGAGPAGWTAYRLVVEGLIVQPDTARTTIETRALVAPHDAP